MKRTLLIAIAFATLCLSGCTIATFEAYRPPRRRHIITYPAHETVIVVPRPHRHAGPPGPFPHHHGW